MGVTTSQIDRTEARTRSAVSARAVRRAANFGRARTDPSSSKRTSLLQSLKLPCCAAAISRPGLPPHRRPETSKLVSTTARTPPLLPHGINFGLNLLNGHRFVGHRMKLTEHLAELAPRALRRNSSATQSAKRTRGQQAGLPRFRGESVGQIKLDGYAHNNRSKSVAD